MRNPSLDGAMGLKTDLVFIMASVGQWGNEANSGFSAALSLHVREPRSLFSLTRFGFLGHFNIERGETTLLPSVKKLENGGGKLPGSVVRQFQATPKYLSAT